jgi:hypothetical protein
MPIPTRTLGEDGLTVGAIGYGAMSFARPYGQRDADTSDTPRDLITRAIELGSRCLTPRTSTGLSGNNRPARALGDACSQTHAIHGQGSTRRGGAGGGRTRQA